MVIAPISTKKEPPAHCRRLRLDQAFYGLVPVTVLKHVAAFENAAFMLAPQMLAH